METVESIFSTPLFKKKLTNMESIDNKIISLLNKSKKQKTGRKKSNVKGFQTELLKAGNPVIDEFHHRIAPEVMNFLKEYHLPSNMTFRLSPLWINSNKKDCHNLPHAHDGEFSIVYYIKVPKNSGGIVFKNPNPAFTMLPFYDLDFEKFNTFNSSEFAEYPKKNELLMFPSHLVHRVEPNLTNQERISLSLNVYLDG